ncbi:ArsR/SmtB family transcription factor [Tardiphaga sp. 538_B7_N1_4]|uniref:ArsR/SmtB family transcription factor n=1 Tax=Tardiphaga sp. 538_B7_N1_4 TaxID=3240778 RepID=UPI003F215DE8
MAHRATPDKFLALINPYFCYHGNVETNDLIEVLDALAQETRLDVMRLLLRHDEGLSSGEVAQKLKVPKNTMSSHLACLDRAGLVQRERRSRFIIYRAKRDYLGKSLSSLNDFLGDGARQPRKRSA